MGGTLRAIEAGYIQNEIQNAAFDYQKAVESGEQIVVGVNRFKMEGGILSRLSSLIPPFEQSQIERLRQVGLRATRRRSMQRLGLLEQSRPRDREI